MRQTAVHLDALEENVVVNLCGWVGITLAEQGLHSLRYTPRTPYLVIPTDSITE